jgi:hypothetical protein
MTSSTITLLSTMEWAKKFNFLRQSGLGGRMEPAITSANTVMQTILGAPFAWRWNRVVTGFVATPGQQDYYLLAAWPAASAVNRGWLVVDSNGNSQSVLVAGMTGLTIPNWNKNVGAQTQDGQAIWTNLGSLGTNVSTTYSFAWIETVSLMDNVQTNPKWIEIETKICLGLDSTPGRPRFISAQGDDGSGNILWRVVPIPIKYTPITITLQQKPPLFTSLNQTWNPLPNEYMHVANWGFLSLMELFADDPRYTVANQKFVTALLSANEGLSETNRNIFLNNWEFITGQPVGNAARMQQGDQSRGV